GQTASVTLAGIATVNFTNQAAGTVGDLVISKSAVGGDGTFTFNVTGPNAFAATRSITTSGGVGTTTISNVDLGAYTVTEATQAGWAQTTNNGQPVTAAVPGGGSATASFVNKLATAVGNLIISKTAAGADGTFTFGVTGPNAYSTTRSITTNRGVRTPPIPNVDLGCYAEIEVAQPAWGQRSNRGPPG